MVDNEEILVVSHVDRAGTKRANFFRSNGIVHPSYWIKPSSSSFSVPQNLPRTKSHRAKTTFYGNVGTCEVEKHVVKTFRLIDFGRSVLTDVQGRSDAACTAERDRVLDGFRAGSL